MMYELNYILAPHITEEEIQVQKEAVSSLIQKNEGAIVKHEVLGKRKLVYSVGQAKMGWYGFLQFDAPGAAISVLEREFTLFQNGLRFLITRFVEQRKRPHLGSLGTQKAKESHTPDFKEGEKKEVNLTELDQKIEKILQEETV